MADITGAGTAFTWERDDWYLELLKVLEAEGITADTEYLGGGNLAVELRPRCGHTVWVTPLAYYAGEGAGWLVCEYDWDTQWDDEGIQLGTPANDQGLIDLLTPMMLVLAGADENGAGRA